MSMEYILLTTDDIVDLSKGKEVYCSLNDTDFAIMQEQAFKDAYLGTTSDGGV